MENTHPVGAVEYSLYATEQRPGGDLRQTAEALLQNGANPTLVDNYLNQHSVPVKPRDVYNIIRKTLWRVYQQLFHRSRASNTHRCVDYLALVPIVRNTNNDTAILGITEHLLSRTFQNFSEYQSQTIVSPRQSVQLHQTRK